MDKDRSTAISMTLQGRVPGDWHVSTIGELFNVQQGKAMSPDARAGQFPRPFLRTSNVLWGNLDLSSVDEMDFSSDEIDRYRLVAGDLLVCEGGEVGRTAIWRGELPICCYQNHIHRLRAKEPSTDPEFYMFWMQAAMKLMGLYGGEGIKTTIPNLSRSRLMNFEIPVPEPSEQRRISKVLLAICKAKAATQKTILSTSEVKNSLVKHLFTYGLVRIDEAENVFLNETEIGTIPKHWGVTKLRDVTENTDSISVKKNPGLEFSYIDVSGVSSENLQIQGYSRQKIESAPSRARKRIRTEDTIFATVRPYLRRVALVPASLDNQVCSTAFCVIRPKAAEIDPSYLFYVVSSDEFVSRVSEHQRGSSYPAVTDKDVLRESIPLPPLDEQIGIGKALGAVDAKIGAERGREEALSSLFLTSLYQLMTGQIRVDNLEV